MNFSITALAFAAAGLLLTACGTSGDASDLPAALVPVPRTGEAAWWDERVDTMEARLKHGDVDLVFLGDSITQGWETAGAQVWEQYYGHRNALNMGCSGDATHTLLWRVQHADWSLANPKLAVLLIGTNNHAISSGEEIGQGITAVVQELRKKAPGMRILALRIFPRGFADSGVTLQEVLHKLDTASAMTAKLADGKHVYYLDIDRIFLDKDGAIRSELMPDLLHLSEAGYRAWAEAMEPTLATLLAQ